eukprot:jgi/Astpho2/752/Aster-x0033
MLSTPAAVAVAVVQQQPAQAFGYDAKNLKKRKVSVDEYTVREDGTRFYDLKPGNGQIVGKDDQVTVHFDCMYKGIDVVSTRSARLLGGNRAVAEASSHAVHSQPFEFTAAEKVQEQRAKVADSAGGLFSGAGGPKPPPAISSAVLGMKPGGKRSIIVPPELGYGSKGLQEIPPNATFELVVEILSVKKA